MAALSRTGGALGGRGARGGGVDLLPRLGAGGRGRAVRGHGADGAAPLAVRRGQTGARAGRKGDRGCAARRGLGDALWGGRKVCWPLTRPRGPTAPPKDCVAGLLRQFV